MHPEIEMIFDKEETSKVTLDIKKKHSANNGYK